MRSSVAHVLTVLTASLLATGAARAQSGPPSYTGSVCYAGGQTTISVTADPPATAILIYPVPPGGGYFMVNDGAGNYTHTINGLSAGTSLTFHLVIQIPGQYEFDDHVITLESGCTDFDHESTGGDPGGGDPGGGGPGNPTLSPRRFVQTMIVPEPGQGPPAIRIEAGAPASPLPAIVGVDLHYRTNGSTLQTVAMTGMGGYAWEHELPEAQPGDEIEYYFTKQVGLQRVETAWFTQIVGEEPPTEPDYPIITETAGRFRDRHPNEWRFDHWVSGYDQGRTFNVKFIDYGDHLDVELTTSAEFNVNAVDIKWFDQAGPLDLCDRANSVLSDRMSKNGTTFTYTIPNLIYGQVVDVEFTLLGSPTYYTEYFYYAMGQGKFQQRWQHPWAYAAGDASISAVTIKQFAFNQHALNLSSNTLLDFLEGKILFETNFDNGTLFNPPTAFDCNGGPVNFGTSMSPAHVPGLLGPQYANASCINCHMMDGRGRAASGAADPTDDYVIRLSAPGVGPNGEPIPHPVYGEQLDEQSVAGVPAEGNASISYQYINGMFDDGTPYELRRPIINISNLAHGPLGPDTLVSARIAPMLIGLGLLEAVEDAVILEYADGADLDDDGISGRPNYVYDVGTGAPALGRFGWKAGQPSLRTQAAAALNHDMGITTSLYPAHDCTDAQGACQAHADDTTPELSDSDLDMLATYLRGLTVPPRENYTDPLAIQGKALFEQANCQSCHRPVLTTGSSPLLPEFANQTIQPFTDLLLHDMGPDLADGRPEFGASGSEWRTPPLWGIGYVGHALGVPTDPFDPNGNPDEPNYLHDGRARSLMEAILWHGGEAQASKEAVLAMSAAEREALIEYVKFPFIDPAEVPPTPTPCPGDANGDDSVDINDLNLVLGNFGTSGPSGDVNSSGSVDVTDLNLVLGNFGTECL